MEKKKYDVEFHGTSFFALVPLLLFVVFCILFFVVFKTFDMMHLCMGGYVSLIIGSLLSKNWGKYWDAVAVGMSSKIMNELALILLIVGMFGKLMTRGGVAQGFVWLGDMIGLSGGGFTAFTFVATCIIATATGTSIGTMFTAFPILYPSSLLLGANPVFLAGAILSGAIFGDNVGPISDTTIASVSTQTYTRKEGTAENPAEKKKIFGGSGAETNAAEAEAILAQYSNPKGLIMLIPVVILLVVAFIKRNIYIACTWGLISGTVIGLVSGILVPSDVMGLQDGTLGGFLIDGVNNMIGTVGYLYAIAGIIGILNASGLLQRTIDALINSKLNQSVVGTEIIISAGLMVSSICLGSANGPAIIMWGPIADDLGKSKKLHPYRRANLMDGFGSTLPCVIPVTSAFIFIALSCVQGLMDNYTFVQKISPVSLAGASLHCWFLFVVLVFSVLSGWGRKYEGPNGEPVKILAEAYDEK